MQFLLVARDQMYAEVNREPDQDGHKCYRQDVQMSHHRRGKGHRIAQSYHQTKGGLERPPGLVVAVNKNQRAHNERHDARHRCVTLRLLHFVVDQNRFARQSHVDAGYFRPGFLDQLP